MNPKPYEAYSPTDETIFDGKEYIDFEQAAKDFAALSEANKANFLDCLQDRLQQGSCPDRLANLYKRLA